MSRRKTEERITSVRLSTMIFSSFVRFVLFVVPLPLSFPSCPLCLCGESVRSSQQRLEQARFVDVGQTLLAAVVLVRQLLVIQAEQVQHRRVQVSDAAPVGHGAVA